MHAGNNEYGYSGIAMRLCKDNGCNVSRMMENDHKSTKRSMRGVSPVKCKTILTRQATESGR